MCILRPSPLPLAALVALALAPSLRAEPSPAFRWQTIDPAIGIGYGLGIADLNGDKKPDIFLADAKDIVCYTAPEWKRVVLASRLSPRDNVCVAAADLDGDGKAEVAAGANWNPGNTTDAAQSGSTHVLQAGADRMLPWSSISLPHEVTVHRMRWVKCGPGPRAQALVVLPLHGQGNKNGEGPNGVKISAHLMPATATTAEQVTTVVRQ